MDKKSLDAFISNFKNRKGEKEEEALFYYLEFSVSDENFNEPQGLRRNFGEYRYKRLEEILSKVSPEVLESNIYLKKSKDFLDKSREVCTDILLEKQATNSNVIIRSIDNNLLLEKVENDESLDSNSVEEYNKIATTIDRFYEEVNRLQMWNLISLDKDSQEDIGTIAVKRNNGKLSIKAYFQNEKKPKVIYIKK